MTGSIKIDLAGFTEQINASRARIRKAARPAAQAAAEVAYDRMKLIAPQSEKAHMFYGTHKVYGPYEPGNLARSIYQYYDKKNSTAARATYLVSWNNKLAPYGHMVELGTSRAPAHPFLVPAIVGTRPEAMATMRQVFLDKVKQK